MSREGQHESSPPLQWRESEAYTESAVGTAECSLCSDIFSRPWRDFRHLSHTLPPVNWRATLIRSLRDRSLRQRQVSGLAVAPERGTSKAQDGSPGKVARQDFRRDRTAQIHCGLAGGGARATPGWR